jgi:hypothetical protein
VTDAFTLEPVGNHTNDESDESEAYVYRWDDTEWVLRGQAIKFANPGRQLWQGGVELVLSDDGDTVLFSYAPNMPNNNSFGGVYLYTWNDNNNSYILGHEFTSHSTNTRGRFGVDIAINSDATVVVIGNQLFDENTNTTINDKEVNVYHKVGGVWSLRGEVFKNTGGSEGGGSEVMIGRVDGVGNVLALMDGNAPWVKVYEWDGSAWNSNQTIFLPSGIGEEEILDWVRINRDGKTIAFGGHQAGSSNNKGAVHVFTREQTQTYVTNNNDGDSTLTAIGSTLTYTPPDLSSYLHTGAPIHSSSGQDIGIRVDNYEEPTWFGGANQVLRINGYCFSSIPGVTNTTVDASIHFIVWDGIACWWCRNSNNDGGLLQASNFQSTLSPSDDRLKYNETHFSNGIELVKQLRPTKYNQVNSVDDDESTGQLQYGFIADEVESIPGLDILVNEKPDQHYPENGESVKALHYNGVMTVSVQALKEVIGIVETQQTEITRLNNLVTTLERRLNSIAEQISDLV